MGARAERRARSLTHSRHHQTLQPCLWVELRVVVALARVAAYTTIHSGRQTRPWFILCQLKKIQDAPCIHPAPSAHASAAISSAAGRCGNVSTTFNFSLALHEKNGARISVGAASGAAFSGEVVQGASRSESSSRLRPPCTTSPENAAPEAAPTKMRAPFCSAATWLTVAPHRRQAGWRHRGPMATMMSGWRQRSRPPRTLPPQPGSICGGESPQSGDFTSRSPYRSRGECLACLPRAEYNCYA